MSRLEILKASLAKKEALVDAKISNHFETVASANGQPLNDKRNGASTMRQWERQNDSIRAAVAGVEVTKAAIEREENKIAGCEIVKDSLPASILEALENGVITQWRRHPETFFVVGVEKGRFVWKDGKLWHRYAKEIPTDEEKDIFYALYKKLVDEINSQKGELK